MANGKPSKGGNPILKKYAFQFLRAVLLKVTPY